MQLGGGGTDRFLRCFVASLLLSSHPSLHEIRMLEAASALDSAQVAGAMQDPLADQVRQQYGRTRETNQPVSGSTPAPPPGRDGILSQGPRHFRALVSFSHIHTFGRSGAWPSRPWSWVQLSPILYVCTSYLESRTVFVVQQGIHSTVLGDSVREV
jgi:hypothetical protein